MEKYFNKLTEAKYLLVKLHLDKNEVDLGSLQPLVVFTTAVDGYYCLTVAVGASVWGVVGVLIPWGGRLALPFFIIIIIFLCMCVSV